MNPAAGWSALALVVAGCASDAGRIEPPTAWDGRWGGRFSISLGLFECPSGGPLEVRVSQGLVEGTARTGEGETFGIVGEISTTGEVADGVFLDGARAVAALRGTFGVDSAAGRWQGPVCEGEWWLRRLG